MEIGTLNQRITFLENRVVTDEIGNHTAVLGRSFFLLGKSDFESFCGAYGRWCDQRNTDTGIPHSAKPALDAVCNRQPNLVSGCYIQHHQCYTRLFAQGLSETYCRSQKGRTK